MKKKEGPRSLADKSLGPCAGAAPRPLSAAPAAIRKILGDRPEPLTQAALVASTGLHPNTVREHLETLVRRGLVSRSRAEPSGRGRPAWLYELTEETPETSEYARLTAALASAIVRTSATPGTDATLAGEEWGRELARNRGAAPSSPHVARDQVVTLLGDLGFQPEQEERDPATVRLTRCPLLEAAHRYPEVICSVHLGVVRGALEEYGADPTGADLAPFSEPGACRLVVPPLDPPVR